MTTRWTPQPPRREAPLAVTHPEEMYISTQNRHATSALAGTTSTATQVRILAHGANQGDVDLYAGTIRDDIAAHVGDYDRAAKLTTLSRYESLGRGVLGATERFLRRSLSPTVRSAIKKGTIDR